MIEPRGGLGALAQFARRHWIGIAAMTLVTVAALVETVPHLGDPFGLSHDGNNAAVWSIGARAIARLGLVASAFGGRWGGDLGAYANHPPAIYVLVAIAHGLVGDGPPAARLVALTSMLSVTPLLYAFLRALQLRVIAAAFGVLVAGGLPMFLVYGPVLDTLMLSLPVGIALLAAWAAVRAGRHVRPWIPATIAALCALTSWQALMLAGVVAAAALLLDRRRTPRAFSGAVAGGALVGAVTTLLWMLWVHGWSIGPISRAFSFRTSSETATVQAAARQQAAILRTLLPMAPGLLLVTLAGLFHDRRRCLPGVAAAVGVLSYGLVFKGGALFHTYWLYWIIVPIAVGMAAVGDGIVGWWQEHMPSRTRWATPLALVTAGGVAVGWNVVNESGDSQWIRAEANEARQLVNGDWPREQEVAWISGPVSWAPPLTYYSSLPVEHLDDAGLREVASAKPAELVLDTNRPLRLMRAAELVTPAPPEETESDG